jgi:hypothetical protein
VDTGGRISPAVWPKAVIVVMGLLCAYEIVKRLVAKVEFTATGWCRPIPLGRRAGRRRCSATCRCSSAASRLIAAYVVVVPWTGFFLTTALFLGIFPWIGGLRRPVLSAAIGLLGSLALVVVFMRVAYISLPAGRGPLPRALDRADARDRRDLTAWKGSRPGRRLRQHLTPVNFMVLWIGLILGMLVAVLPGLTLVMGVVLALPFTYKMGVGPALILLTAMYVAGTYGGRHHLDPLPHPGEPMDVPLLWDGYEMTRKGKAALALGWALVAAFAAGIVSSS